MSVIMRLSKLLNFNQLKTQKKRLFNNKVSFSHTLNLPKSQFPMKHSRALELKIEQKEINFFNLYRDQLTFTSGSYTLHDGPPYANGDVHFGHAINKILKDIIIKRKILENKQVNFSPGWDCHGLPIELKALSNDNLFEIQPEEIRKRARDLSLNAINMQRKSFEQWFLSSDFQSPYLTIQPEFIINQLRIFHKFYQDGLIFRDYMPIYYSPSTKTALAEAELQYNNQHCSVSAFVSFSLIKDDLYYRIFGDSFQNISALVWTTTPWTLLANEAISISESLEYSLIKISTKKGLFIVAKELVPSFQEKLKTEIIVEKNFSGKDLVGLSYENPIRKKIMGSVFSSENCPIILSQHVSLSKGGTGLVHMAPNHGFDDYKVFQNNSKTLKYRKESIVNEDGKLMVKELMSFPVDIIEDNEASKFVIQNLFHEQVLLVEEHIHSYPYDWRTGKSVIIISSSQWFLKMESIKEKCLEELMKVKIFPEKMRKEFVYHLSNRPNWCLSRQRNWGVPIPVFYSQKDDPECMKPIFDTECFEKILHRIQHEGNCDFWWKESETPAKFYGESHPETQEWIKGKDIMDIWFDSGTSWLSVLGEKGVADLYLEGVDQIRGWFQSSLIISVALRGIAPYKSVMIHGFALDKEGKKMSKSLGNVIHPADIFNDEIENSKIKNGKSQIGCGVDGLRFWIAKNACTHNDCHVNMKEFQIDILALMNRLRNTLKFMLAYLENRKIENNILDKDVWHLMPILDKYLLYRIWKFNKRCDQFYDELQLGSICEKSLKHVLFEVATFYITRVKDRLYCDLPNSFGHRSALTVLHYAYHTIGFQLSPILPHIILEANRYNEFQLLQVLNEHYFNDENEIIKHLFGEQFNSVEEFDEIFNFILNLIDSEVNLNSKNSNLLQLQGTIERIPSKRIFSHLKKFSQTDLNEIFQLSHVDIIENFNEKDNEKLEEYSKRMRFEKVSSLKCERCRLYNVKYEIDEKRTDQMQLCSRCSQYMIEFKYK